jgi:hypothetical protein
MEEGEWRRWRWGNMVDGLHIHIWNKTMKPLKIALSGAGRGLQEEGEGDGGDNLTNVQYVYSELSHWIPLYNEYILITFLKMGRGMEKCPLHNVDTLLWEGVCNSLLPTSEWYTIAFFHRVYNTKMEKTDARVEKPDKSHFRPRDQS